MADGGVLQEMRIAALCLGGLAVLTGVCLAAAWRWLPGRGRGLFPPQRVRYVPWNALALLLVYLMFELIPVVVVLCLAGSDLADQPKSVQAEYGIWATCLAFPIQLPLILVFLRRACQAEWYQLGLTTHRFAANLRAGYVFWLLVTPAVFGVLWGAEYLMSVSGLPRPVDPLQELFAHGPQPMTWAAFVMVVIVTAPVVEEILVRGLLQPWLVSRPARADFLVLLGLGLAIVRGLSGDAYWAALFLAAIGAGYLGFEWATRRLLPRPGAARAVFAASLLFAAAHYTQPWPNPIPIFVLSLGLGILSYRTQSLVGSIFMHSLFNAVSLAALAF